MSAVDRASGDPHAERKRRLGLGLLSVYGAGGMVEVIIQFALNNFLLFYLTVVCGLPGTIAGLVSLVSLVVDAAIDPLIGSLSDNTHSRFGRRHPFMILATVPAALALVLLFSIPLGLPVWGTFAYATGLSLMLRLGLSAFQIPYFALGAEMSDDYGQRSTIVAFRVVMGVVGTLAATILSYQVFLAGPGGTTHRANYTSLTWSLAAIIVVTGLAAGLGTLGLRARLHAPPPRKGLAVTRLFGELAEIFRNRSFLALFVSALAFFIGQGVFVPLNLHAQSYFWGLSTATIGRLTLIYTAGLAVSIFLTAGLSRVLEKRTIAMGGLAAIVVAQFAPAPLRLAGLLPGPAGAFIALAISALLLGFGVTAAVIGYQSMMADAADEHEQLFGARREGLYFAGINFSAKASGGVGTLFAGVALDLIRFPHDAATRGAAAFTGHTLRNLALIYGPGAAAVTSLSVALLLGYHINRTSHAGILEALAKRRRAPIIPPEAA